MSVNSVLNVIRPALFSAIREHAFFGVTCLVVSHSEMQRKLVISCKI